MIIEKLVKRFEPSSIIIGFTGSIGSGCTTFAEALSVFKGYKYYRLSDIIYKYAEKNNIEKTRKNLQDIGNYLRKHYGRHYLAAEIITQIDSDCKEQDISKVVIESIRNDTEVFYLKQFPNFSLISVFADFETCFNRVSKSDKSYSLDAFEQDYIRDANEIFEYGQKVRRCNYLADIVINNNDDRDISHKKKRENFFEEKFDKYLNLIENGPSYKDKPNNDERLMTLAYMESLNSSCLQRKVGAVIASKTGNIISTGFNSVPSSERPCIEEYEGCYRRYLKNKEASKIKYCPDCGREIKHPSKSDEEIDVDYVCKGCGKKIFEIFIPGSKDSSGKLLDMCRALHAEENAILNVTKISGESLKDKILYSTTFPCNLCANKISQVGINEVIYDELYTMKEAEEILKNKDIKLKKFEGVKSAAFFRLYGYKH